MKDQLDESLEVYTKKEIEYLDKYLPLCDKVIDVIFINKRKKSYMT